MAIAGKHLRNEKLHMITIERAEKFLNGPDWNDVNLRNKLYKQRSKDAVKISVWSVPGPHDPCTTDRVLYKDAIKNYFNPTNLGTSFGPSWSTHWFKVSITVPPTFLNEEVHLIWDNGSEALIYVDGVPVQSLYGGGGDDRREEFILTKCASNDKSMYELYIEMCCTGMFGNPQTGSFLNPPAPDKTYTLSVAEIAAVDKNAWKLYHSLEVLIGLAKELPDNNNRRNQAVQALEKILNVSYHDDPTTWPEAIRIADELLAAGNGSAQHTTYALGHCHIDTAWLWTYSETRRKVARSWSTQLTLMKYFPKYKFTASQAQQFSWLKEQYPKCYEELKEAVKIGKFIPTGGTWVEMDCNVPSGEAFVRQFLYGQRFFQREFGSLCTEFWLPDTFGYSAQLPQIIRGSNMEFFLTQKLSWNLINKFPHNTFIWEGIDGSQVLSHFPPADTYCAKCNVKELLYTVENHKNQATTNNSMYLFGIGDGGGGPTLQMLERISRMENLDPLPKVKYEAPVKFFEEIKKEGGHPKWIGELYFELHNGTYTTHALVKQGNRLCEFAIRNAEILSTLALFSGKFTYPKKEIDQIWKIILLNQFHDVLPGTSIGPVYRDTHEHHRNALKSANHVIDNALNVLLSKDDNSKKHVVVNTLSWERKEVVELPSGIVGQQKIGEKYLGIVSAPAMGYQEIEPASIPEENSAKIYKDSDGNHVMQNKFIKATFNSKAQLISVIHLSTQRESLSGIGNQFAIFEDIPFYWDAWDVFIYHTDKRKEILPISDSLTVTEHGPLRVSVCIKYKISDVSSITQCVSLDALSGVLVFDNKVTWHESRKFLKVEFPVSVLSPFATYSIQFGNVQRPTHSNTSWDMAKYEVCGHHYADLSEYGFGTSLLSDRKYGFAVHENVIKMSLLRSSKKPDDKADMGDHEFKFGFYPHSGTFSEINLPRIGYEFNQPLLFSTSTSTSKSFVSVDAPNIMVEAIKRVEGDLQNDVEDRGENHVIVRVWETMGGRGKAKLFVNASLPFKSVSQCNLLEHVDSTKQQPTLGGNDSQKFVEFSFKPFEILTFKFSV